MAALTAINRSKFPANHKSHAAKGKVNKAMDKGKMKPKKGTGGKKSTGSPREKHKSGTVEKFKDAITAAANRA